MDLIPEWLDQSLLLWLQEDIPYLDPVGLMIDSCQQVTAIARAKESGIIAGLPIAERVYKLLGIHFSTDLKDGDQISRGTEIYCVQGEATKILRAERLSLNLLTHLSGIATLTWTATEILRNQGVKTRVAATRKTLPGLRSLQKYAIIIGGGYPHRFGLSEVVMLKDNHLRLLNDLSVAIEQIKKRMGPFIPVEVETSSLEDARIAAVAGADIIMLDNLGPSKAKNAASILKEEFPSIIIEVSGNVTLANLHEYAHDAIDYVSMGALTHSVKPLDISCKFE